MFRRTLTLKFSSLSLTLSLILSLSLSLTGQSSEVYEGGALVAVAGQYLHTEGGQQAV